MTKDELVEVVAKSFDPDAWIEGLGSYWVTRRSEARETARAALAIAMPAAFEMVGEAVKDATCQCEACIDILVRKLGGEWK